MSPARHANTQVSSTLSWLIALLSFVVFGYAKVRCMYLTPARARVTDNRLDASR